MATTSNASEDSIKLIDKPGSKSIAWNYFALEADTEGKVKNAEKAVCRKCNKRVAAKNGNTSNLIAHLRTHHHEAYTEVIQATKGKQVRRKCAEVSQPTIQESIEGACKYDRHSITDAITHFVAKDGLPVYTVEKPGFKQLVQTLDSHYNIPSRSYFSKT